MDIRKIAAASGLAIGAALAFAPLASADAFSSIVDSEIAGENSIFQLDTLLAGVPSSDYSVVDGFDTINAADIATVQGTGTTPFDFLIYGVDPSQAGLAGDPGSYNIFNGAVTKFDDALNVLLYAAENKDALIPAGDLFGNHIADALAGGTDASAFEYFWNFAIGDLGGFLQENLSALDISATTANSLFGLFG
ncbi:hypothetical protein GCM10009641_53610 [Mycobacterium cookii]|uniref:Uncharacterized protein n=1 Tax=Mycobacterium cookii TaxID=1775 RepID=A0A7I7KVT9_9MYCO|nr:hypothetical protein [Mycobacterium cookii]MCV7332529.1 hypothetical protein [Mycobacterium cookii]BBX45442.1 hypothetical protein MCOO_14570 [Mycobacterium cookii]